ncbi:MAG: HAD-IB family phosphatase [Candidatus Bathyarchaeia archaeon]
MQYRLVAFDCDGTLTQKASSWRLVHEFFATVACSEQNSNLYLQGEIDYVEFVRRDVAAWPRPLHISTLEAILGGIPLAEGAPHVASELFRRGYELAIVSGGIDIAAERVGRLLNIRRVVANGFEATAEGYLTGEGIVRVDPINKHSALADLSRSMGISPRETVAVGDSELDLSFLSHAGMGVAVGANEKLRSTAEYAVDRLEQLLDVL